MINITFIFFTILFYVNSFYNNLFNKFNLYLKNNNNYQNEKNNNDKGLYILDNEIEIINYNTFDINKFYILIGNETITNKMLLENLKIYNISAIFINKNYYSQKDIKDLCKNNSSKFINEDMHLLDIIGYTDIPYKFINQDLWVFDKNKFIGGYFEFYKIILKKF